MEKFDVLVIGSGVAGLTAAYRIREAGRSVAVADRLPFGGTCPLRGCDSKRVLEGGVEIIARADRLRDKGIRPCGLDWRALVEFKRSFAAPVPERTERGLREAGIVPLKGRVEFTGPHKARVGEMEIEAVQVVIASGSWPSRLPFEGADLLTLSDRFMDLEVLPPEVAFVGGGFISMEFAHIAARAGSRARIIHMDDRPLAPFDRDLVSMLLTASKEAGIEFVLGSPVDGVFRNGDRFAVRSGSREFAADIVVHGAGRSPWIDDMGLDLAGVEYGRRGVKVSDTLASVSEGHFFAAGDCADSGAPQLTPVSIYEGKLAADNLLGRPERKADHSGFASVVFSIPPLAKAGMTEEEAASSGLSFEVRFAETSNWFSSGRVGERHSAYKMLVEKKTDRLLGAHLLGEGAEEAINVFSVAIRHGLKASAVRDVLYAYPTKCNDIGYML